MYEIIYKHYFKAPNDSFDKSKVSKITNRLHFTKPAGGFWGARADEDSFYEWDPEYVSESWCLTNPFYFKIKPGSNILPIRDKCDLEYLPKINGTAFSSHDEIHLDFERLALIHDAIELRCIDKLYYELYGWDCNSILILNRDIIIPCNEENTLQKGERE